MMTLDEAMVAADVDLQTLYRLIETGKLHSMEIHEGRLVICLNSLINFRMNSESSGERPKD
jgi:predicted site-specific integrase-resolvase